ncbi:MAG: CoA pyrophosphatase [Flavobacteriales bacterium]|nr:CoA pyrophosphatase [Flavobacteriales bacterium]
MILQIRITVTDDDFILELKFRLKNRQAIDAKNALMGYPRASVKHARTQDPPPKESAVIMLIYPHEQVWHTLFMRRPDGTGVHSGQLSFPGGKLESGETHLQAARREALEEVGVELSEDHIVGSLTEVYIPPSHFVVTPFLAVLAEEPKFIPNPHEVVELISYPISDFLQDNIVAEKEIFIPMLGKNIQARYFDVKGNTLWGATAMMVQEFRALFGF